MITLVILQLLAWVADALLSLLPSIDVPSWMSSNRPVAQVFQAAGSMGVWFPVQLIASILASLVLIHGGAFLVKITRQVISLFTGGGGSAA